MDEDNKCAWRSERDEGFPNKSINGVGNINKSKVKSILKATINVMCFLSIIAITYLIFNKITAEKATLNSVATISSITIDLEMEGVINSIQQANKNIEDVEDRLIEVLYFECREEGCSDYEKLLILETIFTRAEINYRGSTITEVIESPKQFSYLNGVKERRKTPKPILPDDLIALGSITTLVKGAYSNYLHENEEGDLYVFGVSRPIQYYNATKVKIKPSWVDDSCLIDTGKTLHKFYSCYKKG